MKLRTALLVAALAVGGLAAGIGSFKLLNPKQVSTTTMAAPPIRFTTIDQRTLSLDSLKGRWVLINFWASWCAPCMDELPHLVAAQANYGALGLQIIGPAMDEPEAVQPMLARFQINYPVTADVAGTDVAMRAFGNANGALPFSVLVDPQGFVVERVLGSMTETELRELLERHLRS